MTETIESLSIQDFEAKLALKKPFTAFTPSKSLLISVKDIQPVVGISLHSGHHLREKLESISNLTKDERFYEEDPFMDLFVQNFPIQVIAKDSRYEYDLNRSIEKCVYRNSQECWGKTPWKQTLSESDRADSVQKYEESYQFISTLLGFLQNRFGKVFALNQHSYNYKRIPWETPVFDVLTEQTPSSIRWLIDETISKLSSLDLPNIQTTCKENCVFQEVGHFSHFFYKNFPQSACLTVEIKKIFMDELQGKMNYEMAKAIQKPYSDTILELGKRFLTS